MKIVSLVKFYIQLLVLSKNYVDMKRYVGGVLNVYDWLCDILYLSKNMYQNVDLRGKVVKRGLNFIHVIFQNME